MDKFMSLGQLVMSIIMLLCVVAYGIGNAIKGTIGLIGILAVLFIAYFVWTMVRLAWAEYKQESNNN